MSRTLISLVLLALWAPAPSAAELVRLWELPLGDFRESEITAVHSVGSLAVIEDADHGLTAVSPADGEILWFVQHDGPLSLPAVEGDGYVSLVSGTHAVVVDAVTGRRAFAAPLSSVPAASPVVAGGLLFVPALVDDVLEARRLPSGILAWRYRLPEGFTGSARALGTTGAQSVLVTGADGSLRSLPASTDVPDHETWVTRPGRLQGPVHVESGRIWASAEGGVVLCVDAPSGRIVWRAILGKPVTSGPVVVGDLVVVGSDGGTVGLGAADGHERWNTSPIESPIGRVGDAVLMLPLSSAGVLRSATDGSVVADTPGRDVVAVDGTLLTWNGDTVRAFRLPSSTSLPTASTRPPH